MKEVFRFFIRINFPDFGSKISNDDIDELGILFHKHLDSKLTEEQKQKILPKDSMTVIMQMEHPLKTNGFEPAYVLHFTLWIREQSEATNPS